MKVLELILYLKTLPIDTEVKVLKQVNSSLECSTVWGDLDEMDSLEYMEKLNAVYLGEQ